MLRIAPTFALLIFFSACAPAGAEEQAPHVDIESGAYSLSCKVMVEHFDRGLVPVSMSARYSFTINFAFADSVSDRRSLDTPNLSIPLTSLQIDGYPSTKLPIEFETGTITFYQSNDGAFIDARVGQVGDNRLEATVGIGATGNSMVEITEYGAEGWRVADRIMGSCDPFDKFKTSSTAQVTQ